ADEAWGDARTKLYLQSDLFILPTLSENFGLVIAEALACGLPVITTRAAPWSDLETHRCGWWIQTGVPPLVTALTEALALSVPALHEMGLRGRRLVETHYSWPPLARQMLALYAWLLGHAPKPDYVLL